MNKMTLRDTTPKIWRYAIPEMCEGCTLYKGKNWRCPVQEEPGWLYEKYGTCWSKRTDPAVDKQIIAAIEKYKIIMEGPQ